MTKIEKRTLISYVTRLGLKLFLCALGTFIPIIESLYQGYGHYGGEDKNVLRFFS